MNPRRINAVLAATLVDAAIAACSTEAPGYQTAKLDDVEFDMPLDWQPTLQSKAGRASITYGAKSTEHASKSTITVVRTRPMGHHASYL